MLKQIDAAGMKGKWVRLVAVNPDSVCCETALLVCALRTAGVKLHPQIPFRHTVEKVDGKEVVRWTWLLAPRTADGATATGDLIKRWSDPAWLAANSTNDFAIQRAATWNMGVQAAEIREAIPRIVIRDGRNELQIPANASPARRKWLLDRFYKRIPMETPFVEITTEAAA